MIMSQLEVIIYTWKIGLCYKNITLRLLIYCFVKLKFLKLLSYLRRLCVNAVVWIVRTTTYRCILSWHAVFADARPVRPCIVADNSHYCVRLLSVKAVVAPSYYVGFDVLENFSVVLESSDYMVVIASLPSKFDAVSSGKYCDCPF